MFRPAYFSLLLCALVFILSSTCGYGQQSAETLPRIQVVSVYVLPGVGIMRFPCYNLDPFIRLAPEMEMLRQDFSEFDADYSARGDGMVEFYPAIGLRFNRRNQSPSDHFLLRAGLRFYQADLYSARLSYRKSTPYDTLVSSQTGAVIYRDSIYQKSVQVDYHTTVLQVDLSAIWSTGFNDPFQVYGGVGLALGGSFNNYTKAYTNQDAYGFERTYEDRLPHTEIERRENAPGLVGSLYLPLGVDFRFGKKGFWNQLHFLFEFRPGMTLTEIPELETYVRPHIDMLYGLKVQW